MDDRQHYHLLTETYKMWQGTWMLTYLMPELREQDDIGYIGWIKARWFWSALIFISACFLAIRTGFAIHAASVNEGLQGLWPGIATVTGVITVEGFVAMYGLQRPRSL